MRKVIILQCPLKFQEVIPIFYREASKHSIFDHFYIAGEADRPSCLGNNCSYIKLQQDHQFAGNILNLLKTIDDKIVFMCCEDHIMVDQQNIGDFNAIFDMVIENSRIGCVRLTYRPGLPYKNTPKNNELICELSTKYSYYVSLQPSIWQVEYLKSILKFGEDAWATEIKGSRRATKNKKFRSYAVTKPVYISKNFYRQGKWLREDFVKYAKENDIEIQQKSQVYVKRDGKKSVVNFDDYQ